MYRDNDRYRTFSRRAIFMFGSKFLLMSGLIGRMYYLQVIEEIGTKHLPMKTASA